MKYLPELVARVREADITVLLQGVKGSKQRERMLLLYRAVASKKSDRKEIEDLVFGADADDNLRKRLTVVARDLQKLLLEEVLEAKMLPYKCSGYTEAQLTGNHNLAMIRKLILNSCWKNAREMLELTFRNVRQFNIVRLNRSLAEIGAMLNLGVHYDEKKFLYYHGLAEELAEVEQGLDLVTSRYQLVRNMEYSHRLLPSEISRRTYAYIEECREVAEKFWNVSALQGMYYNMCILAANLCGNYDEAIQHSFAAMEAFERCGQVGTQSRSIMALARVESSLYLGDFDLGYKFVEEAREMIPLNSINFLKVTENAIKLGLQTGRYDYAYEQFALVDHNLTKELLKPQHAEYWLIMEAYMNLLVMTGKIDTHRHEHRLRKFRFTTFLNSVPSFAKDKRTMNVQLLILQCLFFIVKGQFGKVIDRTEALERYNVRYLRADENLRNICFLKFLLISARHSFSRPATVRHSARLYRKMTSEEAMSISRSNSLEIVPYEVLWDIVIDHLPAGAPDRRLVRPSTGLT